MQAGGGGFLLVCLLLFSSVGGNRQDGDSGRARPCRDNSPLELRRQLPCRRKPFNCHESSSSEGLGVPQYMGRGSLPREVSLFPKQELPLAPAVGSTRLPEHNKDQCTHPRLQQPSNSLLTMDWVGWCSSVRLLLSLKGCQPMHARRPRL